MTHAQLGYEAYIASSGGKAWDGRPCPTWDDLPDTIRGHWAAASAAIQRGNPGKMSYSEALYAARCGARIQRAGWNGKGMWVAWTPGSTIHPNLARAGAAEWLAAESEPPAGAVRSSEERIRILGHLDMRAADGSLVVGWLASQTDMLADDWTVVLSPDLPPTV